MSKIPIMPFCTTSTSSFWMPCSLTGQAYVVGMGSSSRLHVTRSQSCGQPHTIPCIDNLTPYDAIMNLCMPEELREQLRQSCSFNTSGVPFSGEGGDFKLQELNKAVQHWIPSVPSDKVWPVTCSNYTGLTKLWEETVSHMGIQDPKAKTCTHHQRHFHSSNGA